MKQECEVCIGVVVDVRGMELEDEIEGRNSGGNKLVEGVENFC